MTILERYLFRRAFTYAAASLVSLVSIVWIVQALSRIDIVKTSASAAGNVFWIALMLLPSLAAGVIPFAILVGAIQALNALNADSERPVISASGASPAVVTRPILYLGMIGAVVMLLIANVLSPLASGAFQDGLRTINADAITLFLKPGRFEKVQDGVVIGIDSVDGSTVKGLVISDTRDPATELTYFAREARIIQNDEESLLLLLDGQLHRRTVADGSIAIIEFQTYAFDLAALRSDEGNSWTRTSEISTASLMAMDGGPDSKDDDIPKLQEELTDRLSNWLFCIAFALWAVAVAGQPSSNRQGTGPAMAIGLAGGLGLKAMGFVALSQIESSPVWIFVSVLLPLSGILVSSEMIRRNVVLSRWSPLLKLTSVFRRRSRRMNGPLISGSRHSGPDRSPR